MVRKLLADLPGTPVAWDRTGSVWETWKAAARLCDSRTRFAVVIQDDAILGRRFHERLQALLKAGGDDQLYCLYFRFKSASTHAAMNEAARRGRAAGGFAFPRFQWGIASAIPTKWISAIIEFGDSQPDRLTGPKQVGDDPRIDRWARSRGVLTWYPLPSLVDHQVSESMISPTRPRRRVAEWFE